MVSRGTCLIPGRLFRVRNPGGFDYPALVAAPGWSVAGELVTVPAADLAALDLYEDFRPAQPAGSSYIRRRLTVRVGPSGVSAWVYVWNRSVAGLRPVPGNAWAGAAAERRDSLCGSSV